MINLEKDKLRMGILDKWDPESLFFQHKKRKFSHIFLCRTLERPIE
jgi:hypothetical protein